MQAADPSGPNTPLIYNEDTREGKLTRPAHFNTLKSYTLHIRTCYNVANAPDSQLATYIVIRGV